MVVSPGNSFVSRVPAQTLQSTGENVRLPFFLPLAALLLAVGPATAQQFRRVDAEMGLVLAGSQACWIDVNQDGWVDLAAGGTLWRNITGRRFERKWDGLGEVVAGDFDNDGWPDLFSYSTLKLYRNLRGERLEPWELCELPTTVSLGACCGDWDNDGWLDLYIAGYEDWEAGITYPSFVLRQTTAGSFQVESVDAEYRSRGATACDFDEDGDADIYISNYRLQPNQLLVNQGQGIFEDRAADLGVVGTSEGFAGGHSIGACWGDFDRDGHFDLFVGNFAHVDGRGDQPKSRFLQSVARDGGRQFIDRGPCGVFYQESYASPAAADIDNDGWLDLFFTTVYESASFGVRNQPTLFARRGDWQWEDVTKAMGLDGLGATYQAAWADFDRDGDLDLATAGRLFRNDESAGNRWLAVQLRGDGQRGNRMAVGAQVRVKAAGVRWVRQVEAGTGQGNQNDTVLHFGLGETVGPVEIDVRWPGGDWQTLTEQPLNQRLLIEQKAGTP